MSDLRSDRDLAALAHRGAGSSERDPRSDDASGARALEGGPTLDAGVLAHAAHASRTSILITDADLARPGPTIAYVNPAFEAMTGYRAEQVVGRSPRILQGPATDRSVVGRIPQDLARTGWFQGEAVNYRADGTPFLMSWRISPVRDGSGAVTHYVAVQDDVTELRRREARDRRILGQLHAGLRPAQVLRVDGAEVVARYLAAPGGPAHPTVPGPPELGAGGDWYEAVGVPGHGPALVIGDVVGHGLEAAADMGRLRWTVRALLDAVSDPAEVADRARRLAVDAGISATMALAVVDHDRLRVVTMGHPPVLVWRTDGTVDQVATPNPMLGLPALGTQVAEVPWVPGEVVVLCTDGLLDGGRREPDELVAEIARRGSPHEAHLDALADELATWASSDDDAALVVARRRAG